MKKPSPDKTATDRSLWEQVTTTIKPLHKPATGRTAIPAPRPKGEDLSYKYAPQAPRGTQRQAPLDMQGSANIDANTLKRLRSGDLEIASKLDLHDHTMERAHAAITRFVHFHYKQGNRCVLVITGRSGKLRAEVPRWLNEPELRPFIVAVAPAQRRDGGEGAVYLLLKRQRG